MAKILLNTRASRITVVANILLLPAEVRADERLGNVVKPSKTLISEQGDPSPYQRIMNDKATQRLFQAGILEWSDEKVDEPQPVPNVVRGPNPLPRADDPKATKRQAVPEADVDGRALIDERGVPLQALSRADDAIVTAAPAAPPGGPAAPPTNPASVPRTDRVLTDEARDALPIAPANPTPPKEPTSKAEEPVKQGKGAHKGG